MAKLISIDVGSSGYPYHNSFHKEIVKLQNAGSENFEVHLFEPLPDFIEEIKNNWIGKPGFTLWEIALSDKKGEVTFYQTKKRNCSSLRKATKSNGDNQKLSNTKTYTVKTDTLDNLLGHLPYVDYLKLDTQGTEYEILKGGEELLKKTKVVKCECGKVQHYEGQKLKDDVIQYMNSQGFVQVGIDREDSIQEDIIFKNKNYEHR